MFFSGEPYKTLRFHLTNQKLKFIRMSSTMLYISITHTYDNFFNMILKYFYIHICILNNRPLTYESITILIATLPLYENSLSIL
jgi:hypothetical protein